MKEYKNMSFNELKALRHQKACEKALQVIEREEKKRKYSIDLQIKALKNIADEYEMSYRLLKNILNIDETGERKNNASIEE